MKSLHLVSASAPKYSGISRTSPRGRSLASIAENQAREGRGGLRDGAANQSLNSVRKFFVADAKAAAVRGCKNRTGCPKMKSPARVE